MTRVAARSGARSPVRTAAVGAVASAVLALALGGCGAGPRPAATARATAGDVTVTVTLLPASHGRRTLRATFTPRRPGFHLYSADLPDQGVDGLGVPTRIAVRGGLAATGRPAADRPTRLFRPAGLTAELPVYPDGPVTFTVPVRPAGGRADGADVVVSYGACSAHTCLMPVTGKALHLTLA